MGSTLLYLLPEVVEAGRAEAHWWLVGDGGVVDSGVGAEWTGLLVDPPRGRRRQVALAPAAAVRIDRAAASSGAASPRQVAAIARIGAVERSLGDPATLHAVAAIAPDGTATTAVVANSTMLEWIEWSASFGADPDHIVPLALLLAPTDDWRQARIGGQTLVARGAIALPFEPALAETIVGTAEIPELAPQAVDEALVAVAADPPLLDLRSGRFARRRRLAIERGRISELVLLALLIPLLTLAWALVSIVRLEVSSDRLDADTLGVAAAALGGTPALGSAEAELAQQLGGGANGGSTATMAALFQQLQAEPGIVLTLLAWRGDGTLLATIAAPTVDEINRLLLALQRDGHVISAVPRQAGDGRSMVDVTIRSRR